MSSASDELDQDAEARILTRAHVLSLDLPASQSALAPACVTAALVFAWSVLAVSPAMVTATGADVPWGALATSVILGLGAALAGGALARFTHRGDAAFYGALSGAIVALAISWMVVPWVALGEAFPPEGLDLAHTSPGDTRWLAALVAKQLDVVLMWNAVLFAGMASGGALCGVLGSRLRADSASGAVARPVLDLDIIMALNVAVSLIWVATGPTCATLAESLSDPSFGGDADAVGRLLMGSHLLLVLLATWTLRGVRRDLRGDPTALLRVLAGAFSVLTSVGVHWSGDGLSTAFWAATWAIAAAIGWATWSPPAVHPADTPSFNLLGSSIRGALVTSSMALVSLPTLQFGLTVWLGPVAWTNALVAHHLTAPTWGAAAEGLAGIEQNVAIAACAGAVAGLTRALVVVGIVWGGRAWRALRAKPSAA